MAAASECNCTFSGVKLKFARDVRIYYAFKTSEAFNVFGVVDFKSILKLYLLRSSFAVFQFNYL